MALLDVEPHHLPGNGMRSQKRGAGGIPSRKKGGRGHLAAKKAEDNEVQWHHGMAGQELRNVPESGLVIIKIFHPRAAK